MAFLARFWPFTTRLVLYGAKWSQFLLTAFTVRSPSPPQKNSWKPCWLGGSTNEYKFLLRGSIENLKTIRTIKNHCKTYRLAVNLQMEGNDLFFAVPNLKVHVFWENHWNLTKSPNFISNDLSSSCVRKNVSRFRHIFLAFSECMNFNCHSFKSVLSYG